MDLLLILPLVALYGLLVGSFINAWVWRIRNGKSITTGRSMCPHCHHQLTWFELIPVFSYIGLRGKCRTCHKHISYQYPLVELLTSLLWVLSAASILPSDIYGWIFLGVWLAILSLLVAAAVYDARWMLLPDVFTMPAIAIASLWLGIRWLGFHEGGEVLSQIIGAGIFCFTFWGLNYFSHGKLLGEGDIGLALIMGLLLSTQQLVFSIFLSFNLGALVGLSLIIMKIKTRKDQIPFGPFLITGLIIAFLFGNNLISGYFSLLGG